VVVDNVVGGWQGEFSVEGDVISQQTKAQTDLDTLTENITIDAIVTGVLAGVVEGSVDVQEALNRIMACIVNSVDIETGVSSNTYTFKDSSGVSTVVEHIITSNGSSRELS